MHRFAQTNLQLYAQLADLAYPERDLAMVARCYELSMTLFPGTYRASGKPFLAHLVGTAGIVAALRARAPVVAAGLLHATYTHGEFGNGWLGVSDAKRTRVRAAVGPEIEDLVARYTAFRWARATIPAIRAQLDAMTALERDVLLIRLANELEDHLDLGILYSGDAPRRLRFMREDLPAAVEMARRLGHPGLAESLAAAFDQIEHAAISPALRRREVESFRLPFASHRPRLRVAVSHLLARSPWH
ncbi:MAG TPA: HD domain-containing protein [Methylomirabilota bacterium]|nr:HD domain-containing protein [Methylomirabilota bacterium]